MSSSSTTTIALRRQHSQAAKTRFYAHLVRSSFASRTFTFLCSILLTLLLVSSIIILVLWLSLRPHRPRFHLSSFSSPSSLSVFSFSISDRNPNSKIAVSYDEFNATLFYNNLQVASGVVQSAFYQPPKNTTYILGQLVVAGGGIVAGASGVELRLELSSVVQFKLSTWDSHHHHMHVSCELAVGADGNLLPEFQGEKCSLYFG